MHMCKSMFKTDDTSWVWVWMWPAQHTMNEHLRFIWHVKYRIQRTVPTPETAMTHESRSLKSSQVWSVILMHNHWSFTACCKHRFNTRLEFRNKQLCMIKSLFCFTCVFDFGVWWMCNKCDVYYKQLFRRFKNASSWCPLAPSRRQKLQELPQHRQNDCDKTNKKIIITE